MGESLHLMAIDLGASSGRAILGSFDGEHIVLREVHKFANGPEYVNGHMYWDILQLLREIKCGIRSAASEGYVLSSIGIDTWGVDYGLLDSNGQLLSNPYHYRDRRTDELMPELWERISQESIYQATGIQFMQLNTLYQLYADVKYRPWVLGSTKKLLFTPDLLNYFLTGECCSERTIASTSQLLDPRTGAWVFDFLDTLGIDSGILQEVAEPAQALGTILPQVAHECGVGTDLKVMLVGSHDTASAVAATPFEPGETSAFLSSGTWSLLGMELGGPMITTASMDANFTNECGVANTIRFLKNISGLWLLQQCRHSWQLLGLNLSYGEIERAAASAKPFQFQVNPDDPRFLNPDDMPEAIRQYCLDTGQNPPDSPGQIARGIYESLAFSYKKTVEVLEELTGEGISTVNMVGGGIQAELLCQLTADITKRRVVTGPVEATAMGNILTQLIALGEIADLEQGRELVRRSVKMTEFLPAAAGE